MPTREISRTFDAAQAAIIVTLEDDLGVRSVHTIHVLEPDGQEADVAAQIAARVREGDERAAKVKAAFRKHGFVSKDSS